MRQTPSLYNKVQWVPLHNTLDQQLYVPSKGQSIMVKCVLQQVSWPGLERTLCWTETPELESSALSARPWHANLEESQLSMQLKPHQNRTEAWYSFVYTNAKWLLDPTAWKENLFLPNSSWNFGSAVKISISGWDWNMYISPLSPCM